MNIQRRHFIKLASLTTASLPFLSLTKRISHQLTSGNAVVQDDAVFDMFTNPKNFHRPFVRWWWNGDRVTKEEALRELDVMKDAGIGGVEINPIKWNENADAIGIPELQWGSDEWLNVVEAAVKGAKEKGIICDMIIGSGWPFGGEFVPRNEQSQIIMLGTKNLDGGKEYSFTQKELLESVPPPSNYKNKMSELFMLRLAPAEMNIFNEGINLNAQIKNDPVTVTVPEGNHVLYYLVKFTGYQSVIQGALGANGPVINHYDKTAVENYLTHFETILTSKLGPLNNYFRAFFTDSIELEGANWCSDMFEQFKQRRDYDVEMYFPYILFKVGEMGNAVNESYGSKFSPELTAMLNRIHYDFEITRIELFHERFIKTFTNWCAKHGVKSRMQAYGMDCHPLEASMMIDIPECETWIWGPEIDEFEDIDGGRFYMGGRNYTMINKFVSSAGHLSGKQLISCEEMTNTSQIFCNTLERVKVTGDQSNLSGVTHSVLHGFNYTPMEAPFPGWLRYGSFFNERNTWWPYFRLWSDYKSRLSSVFQNSVMQADIAVLHPLADLASKFGFQRDPFPNVSYPRYVHRVWEAIHQNGNGCDYVSEHILQQSIINKGKLNINSRSYRALILIEVETIQPETAKALKKFADDGGKIIFVGKAPHISSGLEGYKKKSKLIEEISDNILKHHPETTAVIPAPTKDLLNWYKGIQKQFSLAPYVVINEPAYHVSQLYYKTDDDKDIFFFTNYSAKNEHSFNADFNNKKTAWLWDAETGKRYLYPSTANGSLQISLGPSESKLIVFDNKQDGEKYFPVDKNILKETIVQTQWQISLNHVNETSKRITLDSLTDLKQKDELKNFSGTIIYRTTVSIDVADKKTYLDLGHVYDVSELEVNGQYIGAKWYGDHLYDISKAVQQGENYISIKIVTTLGNYTKSLKNNKAAQEWSGEGFYGPTGLVAPVKILISST
jgi:glycosyl hydrolase family 106( putative alpha-L-rhamnosidase)